MAAVEKNHVQQLVRVGTEQILQIGVKTGIVGFHRAPGDVFPGGSKDKRTGGPHGPEHIGVLAVDAVRRDQGAMNRAEAADQPGCYGLRVGSRKRLEEARHERYMPFRRTRLACSAIPAKRTTSSR